MQLEHAFTVPAGIDQAWQVLLDIERVAPCMPGAALDSVDGDDFTGRVKVRLGPIGLTYKGKASFVEKDEAQHRAVIDAQGKDSRGNGTASAKVTATLVSEGPESTSVTVLTDLNITGKPAQFGRGVMVDVGNKLIGQFADCLAGKLAGPSPEVTAAAEAAAQAEGAAPSPGTPTEQKTPAAAEQAETAELAEGAVAAAESSAPGTPGRAPAAEPASAVSPPNAQRPAAHARPADEVEPIDLLGSAGPAIAKRLVPLLIAVIVVWVVLRRRRS